jgi:hypothetical protein
MAEYTLIDALRATIAAAGLSRKAHDERGPTMPTNPTVTDADRETCWQCEGSGLIILGGHPAECVLCDGHGKVDVGVGVDVCARTGTKCGSDTRPSAPGRG